MIRRGFWLALGAALGVSGYRRAARLAHSLAPASRAAPPAAGVRVPTRRSGLTGRRVLHGAARAGRSTAEGAAFVRDVRDGMAEYLDRQAPAAGRTLESQRGRPAPGAQRRRAAP